MRGTIYTLYSFPAYDNNRIPEVVDGGDIKSSKLLLTSNTVLYNKLIVRLRRVWNIKELKTNNNICSSEFIPLKVNKDVILQEYLMYCLTSDTVTELMESASQGTSNSQQRISPLSLMQVSIPVIPKNEQKHFIELYQQSDKSKFSDFKSRFIAHFLGSSYTKKRLGDVCSVFSGKTVDLTKENEGGPIAYLKVADLSLPENDRVITISSRFVSEQTAKASGLVPIGATIFPKNGAAALHNKKRITSVIACVDMNTMAVYSTSDTVMPEYLYGYLESQDLAALTLVGAIPQIRAKDVQSLTIPVPSVREQEQYVAIMHQADKSKYLN